MKRKNLNISQSSHSDADDESEPASHNDENAKVQGENDTPFTCHFVIRFIKCNLDKSTNAAKGKGRGKRSKQTVSGDNPHLEVVVEDPNKKKRFRKAKPKIDNGTNDNLIASSFNSIFVYKFTPFNCHFVLI